MRPHPYPIDTAYALPLGFATLLGLGAVAAGAGGRLDGTAVLGLAAVITVLAAGLSRATAVLPLAAVAWLSVTGFSKPPYGELQGSAARGVVVALTLVAAALCGLGAGIWLRYRQRRCVALNPPDPRAEPDEMPPSAAVEGCISSGSARVSGSSRVGTR